MSQTIWSSRPADLYGRRKRDRFYTALWGAGVLFGGLASASRWTPSRILPVQRTNTAVITKRELLTPDVVALTLADPDGALLPSWTPGAHIDVRLPSGRRRQYSLCGSPGRRTDYRIAVRRIADGGGGSIEMHDTFDAGDTCVFEGPRNAFYLVTDEHDVLFVIGGIGVTPILPMIHSAHQRQMNWRAVYAGSSREYMPLLDEVVAVAPDRVTVWADDERGRIRHRRGAAFRRRGRRRRCTCAARPPCWKSVRTARDKHADTPLHYERFSPPPVVDGIPFELELARSQRLLSVPANRSALDVMLDRDPATAYSCQQGFCGTCKVKVLAGEVDRRGRTAEGDDEMLVCVSRAKSDRVVIDA